MRISFPIARFVRYRFDYPSLVVDSVRAFTSNEFRTSARFLAALFVVLLVFPPTITLIVAREPFGNEILFAILFIVWPWVLEFPAWSIRQMEADPRLARAGRSKARAFDWFMYVFFGVVAFCAIATLLFEPSHLNETELAALWAVALAGGADMVRSVAAYTLAQLMGFPLYGERCRKDKP